MENEKKLTSIILHLFNLNVDPKLITPSFVEVVAQDMGHSITVEEAQFISDNFKHFN